MSEALFSPDSREPRIGPFPPDMTDTLRSRPDRPIGRERFGPHRSDIGFTPFPDDALRPEPIGTDRYLDPLPELPLDPEAGEQSFERALAGLERDFQVTTYDFEPNDPLWLYHHAVHYQEVLQRFACLLAALIVDMAGAIERTGSPATAYLVYWRLAESTLLGTVLTHRQVIAAMKKLQNVSWPLGMAQAGTTPPSAIVLVDDLPSNTRRDGW